MNNSMQFKFNAIRLQWIDRKSIVLKYSNRNEGFLREGRGVEEAVNANGFR